MGLPGYWAVLFMRAVVQHPAGYDPSSPLLLFEKVCGEIAFAFERRHFRGHVCEGERLHIDGLDLANWRSSAIEADLPFADFSIRPMHSR